MKVLVTGGAGFIGSHTVDKLIEEGNDVIVIDNLSTGNISNVNYKAVFYNEDIRDEALNNIFESERPEYVIHLASQSDPLKSIEFPLYDSQININGTINLLECCVRNDVKKIVFASSISIYGNPKKLPICETDEKNPITQYGLSKLTAENYIKLYSKLYGLQYTILRYANVYGEREQQRDYTGAIPIFIKKLLQKDVPKIFNDGNETRDYIYVKDVVEANILSILMGNNEEINIGSGRQLKTMELYSIITHMIGVKAETVFDNSTMYKIQHIILNINKARRLLGWEPKHSIVDGLINTIGYYKMYLNM
ncbi:NAD-dependent epimerase/dehydratase family protein [Serpentinicella alkaliphila]|uniref:UDP-glucose 4-epimerase n=1 Tax=Serpentinicella alkaliphila TaxID=1734049 RepID=A0A4V2T2Q5_9FIRM|nr:NAD-dependent epimerase/dehydratase family protein [Serpentinicella alkaliphila]QUH26110.1 NAD-dependent epimerase/dehydratase family protein [Serpentinicella alkaliphila]TCP98443.1 UDP-glucose 4-epimerase [Serpentinicella alkaliphila]